MNRRVGWDVDPAGLLSPTKRKKCDTEQVLGVWRGYGLVGMLQGGSLKADVGGSRIC